MSHKISVLILFGGESSEHEVSISSARNVYAALDDTKYEVSLCYIDKTGKWWQVDGFSDLIETDRFTQLVPVLGSGKLVTLNIAEEILPNVILPILHGVNGEDGTVQGLAQLLHIPIVGCKVAASAVTMDKVLTKQILEYNNIKTVPYEVHMIGEPYQSFKLLSDKLGEPLFVKPANGGSSVGIRKAKNNEELINALSEAHKHDKKVLIEKAITARELEVGALGSGNNVRISSVGEICPDREFYDYESKYDESSTTQAIIPADIPDDVSEKIRAISADAYKVLGCEGMSRMDFFLSDDDEIYLNEVNTIPGFTNISMYPKLWNHVGLNYSALIDALILDALEK